MAAIVECVLCFCSCAGVNCKHMEFIKIFPVMLCVLYFIHCSSVILRCLFTGKKPS